MVSIIMEGVGRLGVRIARERGEELRAVLFDKVLVDSGLRPFERDGMVFFPLKKRLSDEELEIVSELGAEQGTWSFTERSDRHHRNLAEAIGEKLPGSVLKRLPRSYDIVGDVAIVELDEDLLSSGQTIGEAFRRLHGHVRLVLAKISSISGEYRVANYLRLWGEGSSETVHRENGCAFKLDVSKVFYTPRLSTERARIAFQVKGFETVADLFAGVGPFSIMIAKRVEGVKVHAVELNNCAYNYLVTNISLNKVSDKVVPYEGDARLISRTHIAGSCDRIIMNLPFSSELFLEAASNALRRSGGRIHLYAISEGAKDSRAMFFKVADQLRALGWDEVELEAFRIVREVSPRVYNVVLDLRISS